MAEEPGEGGASAEGATTAVPDRPTADEAASWAGFQLDELGGAKVGKVEAAYIDGSNGALEWLLCRMGRFGHYCLIPARDAVAGAGRIWVPYTRDQIRGAPRIEPREPLPRRLERKLLDHYGVGTGGRAAEIADGDGEDVTARPA